MAQPVRQRAAPRRNRRVADAGPGALPVIQPPNPVVQPPLPIDPPLLPEVLLRIPNVMVEDPDFQPEVPYVHPPHRLQRIRRLPAHLRPDGDMPAEVAFRGRRGRGRARNARGQMLINLFQVVETESRQELRNLQYKLFY